MELCSAGLVARISTCNLLMHGEQRSGRLPRCMLMWICQNLSPGNPVLIRCVGVLLVELMSVQLVFTGLRLGFVLSFLSRIFSVCRRFRDFHWSLSSAFGFLMIMRVISLMACRCRLSVLADHCCTKGCSQA